MRRPSRGILLLGLSLFLLAGLGGVQAQTLYITGTSQGGHVIQDDGVVRPQRGQLSFIGNGIDCLDNAGANSTDCFFRPGITSTTSSASVTIDVGITALYRLTAQTTPVTFNNPINSVSTTPDGTLLRIAICSATSQAITWGSEFPPAGLYIPTLPSATTGGGKCDLFGFQRNSAATVWNFITTTQDPVPNRRRECPILVGNENGPILTDADIPTTYGCPVHGAATIEQVTIRSKCANTPSVMVHRVTGTNTTLNLLSSSLATSAAGAMNCARKGGGTGLEGKACQATLQNEVITATDVITTDGVLVGVASGTNAGCNNIWVNITYVTN